MIARPDRSQRLFFALWPEAAAAAALHDAARAAQAACGGRSMRRDTLHLTLAFLGDVAADRLDAAMEAGTAVSGKVGAGDTPLVLDRLGCWAHNRIVWAGCGQTPPQLADLAAVLATGLRQRGLRLDERRFVPHVTLLRNARCDCTLPPLAGVRWPVREFVLVASAPTPAGAQYRILRQWPLG